MAARFVVNQPESTLLINRSAVLNATRSVGFGRAAHTRELFETIWKDCNPLQAYRCCPEVVIAIVVFLRFVLLFGGD